jgi:hypothetical protein
MYNILTLSVNRAACELDCVPASFCYGPMRVRRLVDFPYVLVRLHCDACKRAGSYRLARLAVKYGAEILLDDLACEAFGGLPVA